MVYIGCETCNLMIHCCCLFIFIWPEHKPFGASFREASLQNYAVTGMGDYLWLALHEMYCVLESVRHMTMGLVLQHCDTPLESARALSLNGSMKMISGGHTFMLCVDDDVRLTTHRNRSLMAHSSCMDAFYTLNASI